MKKPTTIDGKLAAINRQANKHGWTIRKIWYCNAGWGLSYIEIGETNNNKSVVYTYYDTIRSMSNGEYRRVVLKKNERGGKFLN